MTEVDREIALALLKRLWKRELISEETYVSASSSRFFDKRQFTSDTETVNKITEEVSTDGNKLIASRADSAGKNHLRSAAPGHVLCACFYRKGGAAG